MEQLNKLLMDKLGLDESASQQAIDTVLDFIKDKLPDNVQGIVDAAAKGEMPDGGDLLDKAKGLFGG